MCVNFINVWRDLQFKLNSEQKIFERLFITILFTLRVFARNLLIENCRRNIVFICSFRGLSWDTNPPFTSNKPTNYLLNYGNLKQGELQNSKFCDCKIPQSFVPLLLKTHFTPFSTRRYWVYISYRLFAYTIVIIIMLS